ncbi:MAG: hypothetical protein HDT18_07740 [Oscillibacter sp.]|nr:hypothetical protein [Oscillibacter sp.]
MFTKTHGRREMTVLNRAREDALAAKPALLNQIVNAKPSRCAGFEGLAAAAERISCHDY